MTLKQTLKKGDWIRATNTDGGVVEGQCETQIYLGGSAILPLSLGKGAQTVINVNFWDIEILRANLL